MNRKRLLGATWILGLAGMSGFVVLAQHNHEDPPVDVRNIEMPGPAHLLVMTPFVLPELQSELGLSAAQVAQLQNLKRQMLTEGRILSSQIAAKRKELDTLLGPGTSKGELVKRLFEHIGELKGERLFTGYQTAIKMKAVLTDAQRSRLAALKPEIFQQATTSGLSMNNRMDMMQFLGEDFMLSQSMVGLPAPADKR